jgi:hypothetical protein
MVCRHAVVSLYVALGLSGAVPVACAGAERVVPQTCTYQSFRWNVVSRRAEAPERVRRPYDALREEEIDAASGCTVCEEDQEWIALAPLPRFRVCHRYAERVRTVLASLLAEGAPLHEVLGYRVGRTRGALDANGQRTVFSNHSYGIALDINPQANGLYHDCPHFGPGCRLVRGGPWQPGARGALTADDPIVRALKAAGWRWGGEIAGNQKDFMHFSPSGY